MIRVGANDFENRNEALKLAIEVLKTQPNLLLPAYSGAQIAERLCSMAAAFIPYIIEGTIPASSGPKVQ